MENDDIKLENIFIASMVNDLIKGMTHLHKTDLHFHGNLKSSNCVVTSRWVLQITDYGLHELRAAAEKDSIGDHELYRSKWNAAMSFSSWNSRRTLLCFFFGTYISRQNRTFLLDEKNTRSILPYFIYVAALAPLRALFKIAGRL